MNYQGDVRRIVVGVDDRAESHAALRWAAREAEQHGAELWMVHAYSYPMPIAWHTVPLVGRPECCDRAAQELVSRIEFDQLGSHPNLTVRRIAVAGFAADVLLEASEGAELLVVGAKAGHSMRHAVYGSVARAVERRAPCPVVVVHVDAAGVDTEVSSWDSGESQPGERDQVSGVLVS